MLQILALAAIAQTKPPHSSARIVSAVSQAKPGSPFKVALVIKMDPDWHVYWKNPGDFGMATAMTWKLPKGWTAGPISWPPPMRMQSSGMAVYVYSGSVTLPMTISPGRMPTSGFITLRGDADWLVCDPSQCMQAGQKVSLRIKMGPKEVANPSGQKLIETALRAAPATAQSAAAALQPRARRVGNALELSILVGDRALSEPYFYPAEPGVITYDMAQQSRIEQERLILTLPVSPFATKSLKRLRGTLVVKEPDPWIGTSGAADIDVAIE